MVDSKEIYVSRYHGNDSPSCGKTIQMACKTIALATTQAHWNDTICIDGTETSRDPYPCSSMTSYPGGIYVNRSLTLTRFGKDEVFLKCSYQKQMIFDGRYVSGKVIILFKGLTFINSHVTVQKCSLYIESCVFKDPVSFPNATTIISFESSEQRFSLAIIKSTFSNNSFPCIRVVGSKLKIEVHDTVFINNTDVAVFMIALDTKGSGYPNCFITLTNTSFISNKPPSGASLYIKVILASSVISTSRQMEKCYRGRRDKSFLLQPFYYKKQHTSQSSKAQVFLNVTNAKFLHNIGGAIILVGPSIANVSINKCVFSNNNATLAAFAGNNSVPSGELFLRLVDSNFTNNDATNEFLPYFLLVYGFLMTKINITGLQCKSNKVIIILIDLGMNNSVFILKDSFFENNEKLSLSVIAASNSTLQMKRLAFRGNTFLRSTEYLSIELFLLFVTGEGNQITLEEVTFENNTNEQGRIVLLQLPPDRNDPSYECDDIQKWVYKNYVRFTKVRFYNNHVNSTALRLENGRNILRDCQFLNNLGRGIGTSLFIGEGSASLELINTSFQLTQSRPVSSYHETQLSSYFRGFIYVGSAGPIKLENTNLSVEEFLDIDSYLTVAGSSNASIDNNSVIRCPVGTLKKFLVFSHSKLVQPPSSCFYKLNSLTKKLQAFTFSCRKCSSGFYSIVHFAKRCRPCPYGGNCAVNIGAKPTFWGFPSLSDLGSVNFQHCPVDYCCPYRNISCPYNNDKYLSMGCSGNRTGILCGHCKPNFTETLFSAQCRANEDCTDYWFWPVALFYTLAFALFLLWKNLIQCYVIKLLPWRRSSQGGNSSSDTALDGGGYIKVIFYFYQVASLVFVFTDIEIHLAEKYLLVPLIGWFDFKPISSDKGLVCPIRGLTVASKMFLHASQVIAVLSGIGVIYLLHGALRKYRKISPSFPASDRYLAATVDCLLLGYSTLARTTLKALNCVPIQTSSRFFYDGNIRCWQWWQKLCGVVICVFIVPFVFVLYRGSKLLHGKEISAKRFLYACLIPLPFALRWMVSCKRIPVSETDASNDNAEQLSLLPEDRSIRRQSNTDAIHGVIYGPFKKHDNSQGSGAVYWESVLIGRRLVLISLHTFIVFPFIRMVCLSATCALILVHHMWKKPFKDHHVNHGETASLTALLLLAVVNMAEFAFAINGGILSKQERACLMVLHVVEVIILGIVPFVCVIIFFISVLWQLVKLFKLCWVSLCRLIVKKKRNGRQSEFNN